MQKMSSNHVKRHWMTDFVSVNYLNWMCLVTMGFENSDLLYDKKIPSNGNKASSEKNLVSL